MSDPRAPGSAARLRRRVRWRGIVPLAVVLVLLGIVWWLLLDPFVAWSVEHAGAEIVGARVDVEEANVRLQEGVVVLRGLAVTNPERPMTNLFEASEIVVNLRVAPLLEKKIVIDTVAVRDVRFGTARRTSGALERPSGTSGAVFRDVQAWRDRVQIPSFSLGMLEQAVNVDAIRPESLATLRWARAIPASADSLRDAGLERLRAIDPGPTLDSARALAARLEGANLRTLGLRGARDAVQSTRRTLERLARLDDQLSAVRRGVTEELDTLRVRVGRLDDLRRQDYAYARGLLNVPSLESPDLAPALFGGVALERLTPILAWVRLAERYMPPGIERRLTGGTRRVRAAGTDVVFPRRERLPRFLVAFAEASLVLGGAGAAAGQYAAVVTGITSAPAVYGRPATFAVERTAAAVGPRTLRAGGVVDHVSTPLRDSLHVFASGVDLPTLSLAALGARLDLGAGSADLRLGRHGDSLNVRWVWRSEAVRWERLAPEDTVTGSGAGAQARRTAERLLWNTVSRLRTVDITAQLTGTLERPRLVVGSNVAGAVADALRQQLGEEIRRREREVRARVDALVAERVGEARRAVTRMEEQVLGRLEERRQEVEAVKAELEERLRELTRIPGIG